MGLAALALGVGLGLAVDALRRAALGASFPVDLNFWSEDYFMTSMLRLARGLPTYAPLADASSSIYAPGGPWLHHALLAPFGLSTSVVANRVLSQVALLCAIALGVAAVVAIAKRYAAARSETLLAGALASVALVLAAYTNPVAVGLHPVAHESVVLAAALFLLVDWDRRSPRARWLIAMLLPAAGFLAKQSAGPALALALTLCCGRSALALAPWLSLGAAALALHVVSGGHFTEWGVSLLAAQGLEGGGKVREALGTVVLHFSPSLVVALGFAVRALRRRSDADRAWLRAALVPLAYAPAAIGAFSKTLGGENNLAALGLFVGIVAVAALCVVALESGPTWRACLALSVLSAQLVLWQPRRHVPSAWDRRNAERICGFAAARLSCGERVLLGRGTSCYRDHAVPLDRMVDVHEAWVAGRADELGIWNRIESGHYDLVLVHQSDLARFGSRLWPLLASGYRAFYSTPQGEPANFWVDGWQGYASNRMLFFEKKSAAGEHSLDERGRSCSAR